MKTIFLIDDDADDREIFEEALSDITLNKEIDFQHAENGVDAFDKLENSKITKPDVIFLDLNMPKMDGRQFLSQIKQMVGFNDIPVVIYSTSSNKSDIDFTLRHNAEKFMTKPHSIFELKKLLEQTLNEIL